MSDLLKRVDAEIKTARELNPVMAMGMLAIRKMIVGEQNRGPINRMNKTCENCSNHESPDCMFDCGVGNPRWKPIGYQGAISFKRINGLKPTLQSCTLKVYEEYGELARELGKGQGLSGEQTDTDHAEWVYKVIGEILDSMQSLNTLIFVLADENNVDIQGEVERHEDKLREKGYLV